MKTGLVILLMSSAFIAFTCATGPPYPFNYPCQVHLPKSECKPRELTFDWNAKSNTCSVYAKKNNYVCIFGVTSSSCTVNKASVEFHPRSKLGKCSISINH